MATITFTIENSKLQKVINAMKRLSPIPVDGNGVPLFTDSQWAKESVRRWIISQVKRYEEIIAREATNIQEDDNLIS